MANIYFGVLLPILRLEISEIVVLFFLLPLYCCLLAHGTSTPESWLQRLVNIPTSKPRKENLDTTEVHVRTVHDVVHPCCARPDGYGSSLYSSSPENGCIMRACTAARCLPIRDRPTVSSLQHCSQSHRSSDDTTTKAGRFVRLDTPSFFL